MSWWAAEGGANDSVGPNNGTISGGVTFTSGEVGECFLFNGVDGRVVVPDSPSLNFGSNQDFSIEAWISPLPATTDYGIMSIVDKRYAPTLTQSQGYEFNLEYGQLHFHISDSIAGNGLNFGPAGPDLRDGNFHHVAVTLARTSTNGGKVFVDGQVVLTFDPTSVRGDLSNDQPFRIGNHASDFVFAFFKGRIDEVSLYNRALSVSELQAIYNAGAAGKCPVNNWTNPASAKWESPSWSLGVLPASDQTIEIMNDGYKAVNIDSGTVSEFPNSLTVGSLGIGAPTNGLSTLLLNSFGLNTPLKVLNSCVVGLNGTLLNLGSSFEVDGTNGGTMLIDGGTFNQVGGLTVVNAQLLVHSGYINLTNANLTLGDVTLDSTDPVNTLNQQGGSIALQHLDVHNGRYWMFAGTLYAIGGTTTDGGGNFLQWGGTNYGDITVSAGDYDLAGGMAKGNSLSVSSGFGVEAGAVLDMQSINWLGSYATLSGSVRCDTFNTVNTGPLYFSGDIIVTNTLNLTGSSNSTFFTDFVRLVGGTLSAGTITLSDFSWMDQYDGSTNEVSSGLTLQGSVSAAGVEQLCQYLLWGGLLETPYLGVGTHAIYTQHSGQNFVHGVLSISGDYEFFGGQLLVDGIWLAGALVLNAPQPPGTATVTNTGLMDLNGTLATGLPDAWPGQVRLSASATVGFLGPPAQLHFAPSSELSWTPGALLAVTNWNNVANVHIFFGNDGSALTSAQLAQIQFVNPGGFPPGRYPAQLLSTGELIPVARPTLQAARTGSALVFTWAGNSQLLSATNVAGPYATVSGATSPWTNYFTQPQQFFRLQAP